MTTPIAEPYPLATREDDERDEQTYRRYLDHSFQAIYAGLSDFRMALQACRDVELARAASIQIDEVAKLIAQAQDDAADLVEQLS